MSDKGGLFGSLIYIHRTKLNSKKEKDISSLIDLSIYMHHTKLNLKIMNKNRFSLVYSIYIMEPTKPIII
jgi:hypothetical protein